MERTYHMYWAVNKDTKVERSILIDVGELADAGNKPQDFVPFNHEITEDYGLVTVEGKHTMMLGRVMEEIL